MLLPICNTLSQVPNFMEKPALRSYIEDEFGSEENLYNEILGDFFRHAFDGSGADNFFDAGSCIDGRLTSAWNWCSNLEKKRYFPCFLLGGECGLYGSRFFVSNDLYRIRWIRWRLVEHIELARTKSDCHVDTFSYIKANYYTVYTPDLHL